MSNQIKEKAVSGAIWGIGEKLSLQLFGFIQGIILARLLSPSDYGLIAMTTIFVSLSYTLMDSGFSTALIQKKNKSEIDYSTVFVSNVGLSILVSLLLCLCSVWIADFYNEPILKDIVIVNGVVIFLTSFVVVQDVRMTVHLEFKKKSIVNTITACSSGIFSIILAFAGYGVWSLIYPLIFGIVIKYSLFWFYQHWFPKLQFSKKSFLDLFKFGSKMLFSAIIATIFENLYSLIIGKFYSAKDLGYYSRGKGYASLPAKSITGVVESIAYPIFCELQDSHHALIAVFRRMIRVSSFVIFPIMTWLAVLAKPLVVVLITEKWLPCVAYLQLLCMSMVWWHVHVLNLCLLKAKGYSGLFLKLEIVKNTITILVLFTTLPFGIIYMCVGGIVSSLFNLYINSYYTGTLLKFGIIKQLRDMLPSVGLSVFMALIMLSVSCFVTNMLSLLAVGTFLGFASYFLIAYLLKLQDLRYVTEIICEKFRLKK